MTKSHEGSAYTATNMYVSLDVCYPLYEIKHEPQLYNPLYDIEHEPKLYNPLYDIKHEPKLYNPLYDIEHEPKLYNPLYDFEYELKLCNPLLLYGTRSMVILIKLLLISFQLNIVRAK